MKVKTGHDGGGCCYLGFEEKEQENGYEEVKVNLSQMQSGLSVCSD